VSEATGLILAKSGDPCLWFCPLCGYGPWKDPYINSDEMRLSYEICDCCGTEFGYDDTISYFEEWKSRGTPWFTPKMKPKLWKLEDQIHRTIRPWPPIKNENT